MPIRIQTADHLDDLTRNALLSARSARPSNGASGRVCAVVVGASGRCHTGMLVRLGAVTTICAEVAAVSAALSAGETDLQSVMVVVGAGDVDASVHPCGACRQLLVDLSDRVGHEIPVYTASADLVDIWLFTSGELLPTIPRRAALPAIGGRP